jgi:hypothetical protein
MVRQGNEKVGTDLEWRIAKRYGWSRGANAGRGTIKIFSLHNEESLIAFIRTIFPLRCLSWW